MTATSNEQRPSTPRLPKHLAPLDHPSTPRKSYSASSSTNIKAAWTSSTQIAPLDHPPTPQPRPTPGPPRPPWSTSTQLSRPSSSSLPELSSSSITTSSTSSTNSKLHLLQPRANILVLPKPEHHHHKRHGHHGHHAHQSAPHTADSTSTPEQPLSSTAEKYLVKDDSTTPNAASQRPQTPDLQHHHDELEVHFDTSQPERVVLFSNGSYSPRFSLSSRPGTSVTPGFSPAATAKRAAGTPLSKSSSWQNSLVRQSYGQNMPLTAYLGATQDFSVSTTLMSVYGAGAVRAGDPDGKSMLSASMPLPRQDTRPASAKLAKSASIGSFATNGTTVTADGITVAANETAVTAAPEAPRTPSNPSMPLARTVTELGVTLAFLQRFALSVPATSTTQQVVTDIIVPATKAQRCRYVRYAELVPPSEVRAPTYFICHRWNSNFHDMVNAVASHLEDDEDAVVWLDIFAINQHPNSSHADVLDDIVAIIQAADKTIVCLDPQAQLLTRTWCLFEILCAATQKGHKGLTVLCKGLEVDKLSEVMQMKDILGPSTSSVPLDRERIMAKIEQDHGAGPVKLTHIILHALVGSAREEVRRYGMDPADARGNATLWKLMSLLRASGSYEEAEAVSRALFEYNQTALGPDSPDTATAVSVLASCVATQGRNAEAEPLFRQALDMCTRVLGPDHPSTVATVVDLATCVFNQGRYSDAEPLHRQALETCTRLLGAEHPDVASSMNNLAVCMLNQGRHVDSHQLHRQALAIRMRALGADHPDTVSSMNNLAVCVLNQGRDSDAEPLFRQVLEIRTKVLGPTHPDTASCLSNLASCLSHQGRHDEAEPLYRQALEIRATVLGHDHPNTAASISNLANCLADQGNFSIAEPLYRQALDIRTRVLGLDHPSTALCICNVAHCLTHYSHHTAAEPMYRQALGIRARLLGRDHPATVLTMDNLAKCLSQQGRPRDAEPFFQEALAIRKRTLGVDKPLTLTSAANLADCRSKFHSKREARGATPPDPAATAAASP